jgi:hypothetical protein
VAKPTHRRFKSFRIDEISAVDNPAQAHAKVAILKRADPVSAAVSAFMVAIKAELPDVEVELAKVLQEHIASARKAAGIPGDDTRESHMPDDAKKVADLEKAVADLTKSLANEQALRKKAEGEKFIAETVAKFSADERAFYDKADTKAKAEFLADKPEDRAKKVDLAKSADESFTTADGATIRKSEVGAAAYGVLKTQESRLTEATKAIAAANGRAAMAEFTKRASDEMAHLPGETVAKAALLKAVNEIPEAEKTTLKTILTAAEKMAKAGFGNVGAGGGRQVAPDSAQAELTQKAEEIRKGDAKLTPDAAMVKAIEADPSLYDRAEAEKRQAAN